MLKTIKYLLLGGLMSSALFGCSGKPKLTVSNNYFFSFSYEATLAGESSAYLSGQLAVSERRTLELRIGKNLLFFTAQGTSGSINFIDSLKAEKGEKYSIDVTAQYVSGHQHNPLRPAFGNGLPGQSAANPLR